MALETVNKARRIRGVELAVQEAARTLRREMTLAEQILWQALRGKQLDGLRFRKQHPVGQFVLDFYAPRYHLAVEVDGRCMTVRLSVTRSARPGYRPMAIA